jgi:hypothetical protein
MAESPPLPPLATESGIHRRPCARRPPDRRPGSVCQSRHHAFALKGIQRRINIQPADMENAGQDAETVDDAPSDRVGELGWCSS